MEELCERLDAMDAARAARGRGTEVGVGTSDEVTGDIVAEATPEESEEVRERHRRLLAEIRSCFRLLSIHSRLSGSESPRTRRISTQTDSCESLHFLATEKTFKGNSPRVLRGLSPTEDAQNSLLYDQLIIDPSPSSFSCRDSNRAPSASSAAAAAPGLPSDIMSRQEQVEAESDEEQQDEEPCSESIHDQRLVVNPTSRFKTVLDLSKTDVINVVEWLYRDHPGAVWRAASRQAMEDQEDRKCLTYGEVSFVAFANLLEKYAPSQPSSGSPLSPSKDKGKVLANSPQREDIFPRGFTFYDLGCGAGRPVYMASLLNTNCTKSCGIEIVPNMHEMNKVLLRLYNLEVQPNLHPKKQSQKLGFLFGDFLQIDWSDADIVFTNATCFGDPLFSKFEVQAFQNSLKHRFNDLVVVTALFLVVNVYIRQKSCKNLPALVKDIKTSITHEGITEVVSQEMAAQVLKIGAIVISVTRAFTNLQPWELLETQERQMSWAPALVYVYRKQVSLQGFDTPSPAPESTEAPGTSSGTQPENMAALDTPSVTQPESMVTPTPSNTQPESIVVAPEPPSESGNQ